MEFSHVSVLLSRTIDELKIREDGIYGDGTLGGGGHSLEICRRLTGSGRLFGFDVDESAIKAASERLKGYDGRVTLIRSNYRNMVAELRERGIPSLDGIVLDLGVSSHQLDEAERANTIRLMKVKSMINERK